MRDFECPRCKRPLSRIKTRHGLVFGCPSCDGRAAGFALLRKILGRDYVNSLWSGTSRASEGNCPACNRRMAETDVPVPRYRKPLKIDLCKSCYFAWFDRNELEAIPHRVPPAQKKDSKMSLKARQHTAMTRIKQIQKRSRTSYGTGYGDAPEEVWQWIPGILGMPIEENAEAIENRPMVTWTLTAVMLVVFLATWRDLGNVVSEWGFIPAEPGRHAGLTLLTAFFLHGGLFHLIGNGYFLMVFGDNVEDFLGTIKYVVLIAAATLAGHFAHSLCDPYSTTPCVGASGGISGIVVFYALRFPRARIKLLFWYFYILRWISVPAYGALALWMAYQILLAVMQAKGLSNVSAFAHLGGAATGLIAWILWRDG